MRVWPSGRAVAFQATHTGSIPVTRSIVLLFLLGFPALPQSHPGIRKAVAFLSEHVASWPQENQCFSCHNNADGYRALLAAQRSGYAVPEASLAESRRFLAQPDRWTTSAPRPGASDLKLARLQFALAGQHRKILQDESEAGIWRIDTGDLPGSPITWGSALATALAYQQTQDPRARAFLAGLNPTHTVDLAAQGLVLGRTERLQAQQNPDGSWGPRAKSPGEVFDTAIAILALDPALPASRRACAYLEREQLASGAWPETTRPSGGNSYAHHISTTAWATLALLHCESSATRP